MTKRTTKQPRDYSNYTVERFNHNPNFFIGGLDGDSLLSNEDDAKMICDALEFYKKYKKLERKLHRISDEIRELVGE